MMEPKTFQPHTLPRRKKYCYITFYLLYNDCPSGAPVLAFNQRASGTSTYGRLKCARNQVKTHAQASQTHVDILVFIITF